MEPIHLPAPDPQVQRKQRRQYGEGLAIGMLPVILTWIVPGFLFVTHPTSPYAGLNAALAFLVLAAVVYFAEIFIMIAMLANPDLRNRGYGLLTMILVGPVISYVGCVVVPQFITQH